MPISIHYPGFLAGFNIENLQRLSLGLILMITNISD